MKLNGILFTWLIGLLSSVIEIYVLLCAGLMASVLIRLENFLAGETRMANSISGRCADATRCSGRTQWPDSGGAVRAALRRRATAMQESCSLTRPGVTGIRPG